MHRIVLILATLIGATPALSQDTTPDTAPDMTAECAMQAEVVMQLVTARIEGTEVEAAAGQITDALPEAAEKYASVLPLIADWVYTLPEDQLGPEVGESWRDACLAQ